MNKLLDVVVIGAGPAGLTCAGLLAAKGRSVRVIDKGRGPGGRLSTRRGSSARLDHGCQFLATDDPRGNEIIHGWDEAGVSGRWSPRMPDGMAPPKFAGDHWRIGIPAMNEVVKHLTSDLDVEYGFRAASLRRMDDHWVIEQEGEPNSLAASRVVVAIPSPQAIDLLKPVGFSGISELEKAQYDPVWSLLLEGDSLPQLDWDALVSEEAPLGLLAVQSSKPGRSASPAWVGLATTQWSREHLEDDHDSVQSALVESCSRITGEAVEASATVHRWRHAIVSRPVGVDCVSDLDRGLIACGDWCLGPTVSHALASGQAAARQLC